MPLLTAKNSRDATLLKLTCSDVFYFDRCPKQAIRRSLEASMYLSEICNVSSLTLQIHALIGKNLQREKCYGCL